MRKLFLIFALAAPLPSHAQSWPSDSAIKSMLAQKVTHDGVGVIVGLVEKGKPVRIVSSGSTGTTVPLSGNTVFEIGSITKTFTTAILADMVRRGEVSLDDPVAKYLPATVRVPSRGGRQITLIDLATQSSGLPRLPTNLSPVSMDNPYVDYTVDKLYAFLNTYELPRDIGARFEYSNLGMGLLGHVLSLRAGKSYEELVTERVLKPLGMTDTRIVLTPSMRSRLATGHNAAGVPVGNWDLPAIAGAGALRSTVNDMAKFLAANLDSTSVVGRDLAVGHFTRREAGSDNMKIGLAWLTLVNQFGKALVWHNGGTGGYRSWIGFDPTMNRGAIVLTNQSNGIDDVGFHLLDERFPIQQLAVQKEHKEITIDPGLLDAYVGVYELAPNFTISVTKEGNSLMTQATNQGKIQVYPESETSFFLKVVEAQIEFVKGADGKVNEIILHQNGATIPGKRIK